MLDSNMTQKLKEEIKAQIAQEATDLPSWIPKNVPN